MVKQNVFPARSTNSDSLLNTHSTVEDERRSCIRNEGTTLYKMIDGLQAACRWQAVTATQGRQCVRIEGSSFRMIGLRAGRSVLDSDGDTEQAVCQD